MSGHSKWASIKHKKAAVDAKRGKIFSRLSKEITVAAKMGGGDPVMNPRLRTAIATAKGQNMPNDNIDKAVKKGTGELPGVTYEECVYEGYGVGGVAILIEAMTDNKNRTTAEIRSIFNKRNGNMASTNAVAWMFEKKGFFVVNKSDASEEKLLNVTLDAGAEDMKSEGDTFEVYCAMQDFEAVKEALEQNQIPTETAEITALPNSTIKLESEKEARQILDLIEILEDHDDVQNVYANFDIPEEILEQIDSES